MKFTREGSIIIITINGKAAHLDGAIREFCSEYGGTFTLWKLLETGEMVIGPGGARGAIRLARWYLTEEA